MSWKAFLYFFISHFRRIFPKHRCQSGQVNITSNLWRKIFQRLFSYSYILHLTLSFFVCIFIPQTTSIFQIISVWEVWGKFEAIILLGMK